MKNLLAFLTLISLTTIPIVAHADTITYGPLTIGSGSPFGEPFLYDDTGNVGFPFFIFTAYIPDVELYSQSTSTLTSGILTFSYDLAPGWTVADMRIGDEIDFGTSQTDNDDWAVAFFQEVILCPADSPSSCTAGALDKQQYGKAPIPVEALTPDAVAGPGTGIFQYAEYADNASFRTDGGAGIIIELTDVPEPSTFVSLATGFMGVIVVARRRLR